MPPESDEERAHRDARARALALLIGGDPERQKRARDKAQRDTPDDSEQR